MEKHNLKEKTKKIVKKVKQVKDKVENAVIFGQSFDAPSMINLQLVHQK